MKNKSTAFQNLFKYSEQFGRRIKTNTKFSFQYSVLVEIYRQVGGGVGSGGFPESWQKKEVLSGSKDLTFFQLCKRVSCLSFNSIVNFISF